MVTPLQPSNKPNPTVIKKYANRRLYNTDTSNYVTLDDLCQMIKRGDDIVVYDAKNGDDITRSVLTQIIVEQEAKDGQNLLPTNFLRQIISMYGNNMQGMLPNYLEFMMQGFSKNQSQMQDLLRNSLGPTLNQNNLGKMFPMGTLEEMGKQNMAMFEQAMRMFAPFAASAMGNAANTGTNTGTTRPPAKEEPKAKNAAAEPEDEPEETETTPAEDTGEAEDGSISDMQARLNDLQKQIAAMQKDE